MVFVLDKRRRPLVPCSEKRARLLLQRGRAVIHRRVLFAIHLKDRTLAKRPVRPSSLWDYLLCTWQQRCAYAGATQVPLKCDHLVPRSRGGSDRVSNWRHYERTELGDDR